ncbi:ABC transporter permease [Litorilinea aerophila]|uniref:ABC transporter permease n=1 Tax=Litorilinea aerophila TaxID=1204385 RepID=A0A540VFP2_9CHLR|nr:ABC transporter permease [Litorilinea aerophila]MCC9076592.1 ABC transporter permease [Litorilinea aerophila]
MLQYIVQRLLLMVITLIAVSIVSFVVIELPPGDYLTAYTATLAASGDSVDQAQLEALKHRFGLDLPLYQRYFKWIWGVLHGDFGYSFGWNKPVSELIWERVGLTFLISFTALIFTWILGFVIGVYSAVRQYSIGDYIFTAFSFIGLGIPDFLLALVLLWVGYRYFDTNVGGLFSREFQTEPWSWAKFVDMLKHLWVPLIILGIGGTAGLIRVMRANLLDELRKPYVETARAKGVSETKLLLKYPVRIALNPFVSTAGWALPGLINGATIISIVLSLPTTGPLLLNALLVQDMYLAASFILILSALTVIGTLLSDIMLAWLDPRIRYQ